MQISVLAEQMRREGYEVLVSRPSVIMKEIDGSRCEPFENVWVEVPEDVVGGVMKSFANRKGKVINMEPHSHGMTLEANVPTRGLIGFESELMNMTSGHGVMSHLFDQYKPYAGELSVDKQERLFLQSKAMPLDMHWMRFRSEANFS
jgi:GTP-binding protein